MTGGENCRRVDGFVNRQRDHLNGEPTLAMHGPSSAKNGPAGAASIWNQTTLPLIRHLLATMPIPITANVMPAIKVINAWQRMAMKAFEVEKHVAIRGEMKCQNHQPKLLTKSSKINIGVLTVSS